MDKAFKMVANGAKPEKARADCGKPGSSSDTPAPQRSGTAGAAHDRRALTGRGFGWNLANRGRPAAAAMRTEAKRGRGSRPQLARRALRGIRQPALGVQKTRY